MKLRKKLSFLDRLAGNLPSEDALLQEEEKSAPENDWIEQENEEGQLTVDVFQTPDEIILKTMVAGVKPEDLDVTITRDMVTIRGKREEDKSIMNEDYFFKELYWGTFSRAILLPEEVDPDHSVAQEHHGLLTVRLPKIDKEKSQQIKVKSG